MFGPNDYHVPNASESQTRSGILTPASDYSINSSDGAGRGERKRKRDGNTMEDLLKESFAVKPYPTTVSVKPRNLQPLMLLPRSRLPLSALDIVSSARVLPQSRLFEAHVKILELEERMVTQPMILIARLDDARTLYAVERESRGLYVLCQLGSWVNLQEMKAAAVASREQISRTSDRGLMSGSFHAEPVPLIAPESGTYTKKKRLAIEAIQSMVKRPSTGLLTEPQSAEAGSEPALDPQQNWHKSSEVPVPHVNDMVSPPTAIEIFENVRNQYFEALYLSKASLAYFAKGPLSRARAAFHLDYDSTLELKDHIAFLEGLILSTTLIDKKYRDGVPNCVSLIDVQDHSADDTEHDTAKAKKRKSSKKAKPGKDGLYPSEDTLIRRWWANHDIDTDSGAPGSSMDELTKSRISQLRMRETQLQIIVILEVLALQPLASISEEITDDLPSVLLARDISGASDKPAKSKKPAQLTTLIDVHIDRLCIWQSVALEGLKAPSSESQSASDKLSNPMKHTDNVLRDFCIEVIAPFFSARLPDRCGIINRKLGGPVVVSPPKPKMPKSASFSGALSRPGAATKRPIPAKPRRSLQRVLTDDRERRSMSRGPNKAISLMRSATMPTIPGMKREGSEAPSLSSIPAAESQSFTAKRGGLLNSRNFARREVDMSSLGTDINAKDKKKAIIEAELKEAISALKKPNRELAGKALAETADKRSASASKSRKSKKPIRNPLFQGVQITATPKAQRQKDMLAESQVPELVSTVERTEWTVVPPSSLPRIPQSAVRNPLQLSSQATPTRKSLPSASQQMGQFLSVDPIDYGGFPPSSPLHVRRSSAQLFSVPDSAVKNKLDFSVAKAVQETPVKGRVLSSQHSHPTLRETGLGKENGYEGKNGLVGRNDVTFTKEDSIYKSLGWDDGDDIDDLA